MLSNIRPCFLINSHQSTVWYERIYEISLLHDKRIEKVTELKLPSICFVRESGACLPRSWDAFTLGGKIEVSSFQHELTSLDKTKIRISFGPQIKSEFCFSFQLAYHVSQFDWKSSSKPETEESHDLSYLYSANLVEGEVLVLPLRESTKETEWFGGFGVRSCPFWDCDGWYGGPRHRGGGLRA